MGYGQATRLLGVGARRGVFWGQRGTRDCQSDRRPPGTDGLPRDCQSFTPSCTARRKGTAHGVCLILPVASGLPTAKWQGFAHSVLRETVGRWRVCWPGSETLTRGFSLERSPILFMGFAGIPFPLCCHRATSGFMYTACRGTIQRCFLGQERFWRGARSRCPRDNAGKRALLDKPAVVRRALAHPGRSAGERPINIRTLGMRSLG